MFFICCSEFLLLHAVVEEQEGWVLLTVLGVGESETSLNVHALTGEDLEFIEFSHYEFNHLGGTLLEIGNSVLLSVLLEPADNSLQVSLDHSHNILLCKGHLLELVSLNNIDNSLTFTTIILVIS